MGAEVIFNHADFRLMDKRALDALSEYNEVNLFLRGMVPMIGLKMIVFTMSEKSGWREKASIRCAGCYLLPGKVLLRYLRSRSAGFLLSDYLFQPLAHWYCCGQFLFI